MTKKKESYKKDIRRTVRELEEERQERYIELRGIDPKEYRAVEEVINKKYREFIDGIGERIQPKLEALAKKLEKSKSRHTAVQKLFGDFREKLMEYEVALLLCGCGDYQTFYENHNDDYPVEYDHHCPEDMNIIIDGVESTLADAALPENSFIDMRLTYNDGLIQAQPYLEVRGTQGQNHDGTITSCLVYRWNPVATGRYCIKPEINLIAHWLLWPRGRGGCGSTTNETGSGLVEISLKIEAYQTGQLKGETSAYPLIRKCVNRTEEGFETLTGDNEDFVYFDSNDNGPVLKVDLEFGETTEIRVIATVRAEVYSNGWAILNLSHGNASFFRVPSVAIAGHSSCWVWPPYLKAYKDYYVILREWPFVDKGELPPRDCLPGPRPVPEI
ncbi:MAG: hypothetical protein ACXABY_25890 [Candidatus Thorarchaeota archaeon]|jgi:hypothetical protein